jgi:hypothetical protein
VVCWGANDNKQCNTPASVDHTIAIAAGDFHTLALKSDGTVAAWGANQDNQCSVPTGLKQVIAIAAGHRHSVALKADGTVVAWGNNDFGQTTIPSDATGIASISAGGLTTALLQSDGAKIAAQPESKTVLAGRNISFTVSVPDGESLRFQWFFNGSSLADSAHIQGSAKNTLSLSEIRRSDAGVYSVDVYDGNNLIRSANALLVVRSLMELDAPVINGGVARVSFVDAEGEPLSLEDAGLYQFQWSSDLNEWFNIDLPLTAESGKLVASDPAAGNGSARFYRVTAR